MTKHTDEVCISDNTRALNQCDDSHLVLCELPSDGAGLLRPQVQGQVLLQMQTRPGWKLLFLMAHSDAHRLDSLVAFTARSRAGNPDDCQGICRC